MVTARVYYSLHTMNRQLKFSTILLPLLALAGFIASEIYLEQQANKSKIFQLKPIGQCDISNDRCLLQSGEFTINIANNVGMINLKANFPLDKATLFIVSQDKSVTTYPLAMQKNRYAWQHPQLMTKLITSSPFPVILRLIAEIKGGKYIVEFASFNQ